MLRILQISLTLLISTSGIIFACAEQGPVPGITPLVAVLTLYFVDWKRFVTLTSTAAGILGLLGLVAAVGEFFTDHIEARLLAGGHLIVYLSWVFLVQRKENRHYWWICALSILQMAVASVLTTEPWFGIALVIYTFIASWTLCVFLVYRSLPEEQEGRQKQPSPPQVPIRNRRARHVVGDAWKGVSRDVDRRLLNWRFVGSTLVVTCFSLVLSLMFFLLTPRVWIGQYSIFGDDPIVAGPLTGFTDEVRLGDLGEILENSDPVMEVRIYHRLSLANFTPSEYQRYLGMEPLFRGAVLESYENGRWFRSDSGRLIPTERHHVGGDIVQDIELQPIGSPILFGFGNTLTMQSGRETLTVFQNPFSNEYSSSDTRSMDDPYRYQVYADPGAPDTSAARLRSNWSPRRHFSFRSYLASLTYVPENLDRVNNLAVSLTENAVSYADAAETIQAYLQNPENFSYSLKLNVQDASVDPLVDFLFNRKQGHCEYFASAMAIMLRSLGIPTRVISGFKGGQLNENRGVFVVQQLHAHSWVEAYINGRWQTFDPTPGARDLSVADIQGATSGWKLFRSRLSETWNFSVRMSRQQQRQMIYEPIMESARTSWMALKASVEGKSSGLRWLWGFLTSPERWFSWQGGVVAIVFMVTGMSIAWVVKKIVKSFRLWSFEGRIQKATRRRVDFYERLLKILRQQRIEQRNSETAREFVSAALVALQDKLDGNVSQGWSDQLVDAFYRVRFGGEELTAAEASSIDQQLGQLEAALVRKEKRDG